MKFKIEDTVVATKGFNKGWFGQITEIGLNTYKVTGSNHTEGSWWFREDELELAWPGSIMPEGGFEFKPFFQCVERYNDGYRVNGVWFSTEPTSEQIDACYNREPLRGDFGKVRGNLVDETKSEYKNLFASVEQTVNKYLRTYPYDTIDIYRVLEVYEVTDPCIQHAVKKLLCAGKRGYKETGKDIKEAVQALQRWEEMRKEENGISS